MQNTRLDDMIERYGELCTQKTAAHILGIVPRTVHTMMEDGRLRRVGKRVDVRSIADYIENPGQKNYEARVAKGAPTAQLKQNDFLMAARTGRWSSRTNGR